MGKYDEVVDKLPMLPAEEPAYQAKVEAKQREIFGEIGSALSSGSIAQLYATSRMEKEELEKKLYEVNLELNAITQMLVDRYEIDGINSLKLDSGETIRLQYEPYAVVEDREKVWQWCKDNGHEREMQLHWSTLNTITKDRLLQGQSEPDGVRAYVKVKPIFSRG